MSTTYPVIAPIVEGHGEERALRGLLQRLVPHLLPGAYADIQRPHRFPRERMLKRDPLATALTVVTARTPSPTGVLASVDADDDCAVELAQQLHGHAQATHAHVPLMAVVAVWEFEAWFLAGAAGLSGRAGLPTDLHPHPPPRRFAAPRNGFPATCRAAPHTRRPPTSRTSPSGSTSMRPAPARRRSTSSAATSSSC
ncbi:DUF4276 family protein [Streptomyces mirabilis]